MCITFTIFLFDLYFTRKGGLIFTTLDFRYKIGRLLNFTPIIILNRFSNFFYPVQNCDYKPENKRKHYLRITFLELLT